MKTTNKIHYVYKITNLNPTDERLYYIGVKSSLDPDNDNYMGSSKYLDEAMKEIGSEHFKKEVLSTWETRKLAMQEEIRLHEEFDVACDEMFYNKCKARGTGFDTTGTKMTEAQKQYLSKLAIGRKKPPITDEARKNLSKSLMGHKHSEETKNKISLKLTDKIISEETKLKMSSIRKGQKKSKKWKDAIVESNIKRFIPINIYDNNGVLKFTSDISFKLFCKNNDLPFTALYRSHSNNGSLLFQTINGKIEETMLKYKGWYALKQEN